MNVSSVGNPLLRAAHLAAQERKETDSPKEPATPAASSPQPEKAEAEPGRSREELEQLADDVLSVFEGAPERLEELVATLKRLEAKGKLAG